LKKNEVGIFPDYETPPLVEVSCGILFKPLESLLTPHIGLLWGKFKSEFPDSQEVPPLIPAIERFGEPTKDSTRAEFQILERPPLPRIWFLQSPANGIIQFQRDRFLYNWRKIRPEDEYPRYHNVLNNFRNTLNIFEAFLKETNLGEIEPLQYELTYFNNILQGEGWNSTKDIEKIFRYYKWESDSIRFLPHPEDIIWRTSFDLPDNKGRFRVRIQKGKRPEDGRNLIQLELLVRGIGKDISKEQMWSWFDLAHEWIVCGFSDLTTDEIQEQVWRRKK